MKTVSPATLAGSLVIALVLLLAPPAQAEDNAVPGPKSAITTLADGVTKSQTFTIHLDEVKSGQNEIRYKPIAGAAKPAVNGWITRIVPNLVDAQGNVPLSSKVMFHHGVWINQSRPNASLFYATGEEKTQLDLPDGYGYRYKKNDNWILNEMIHNLTPEVMDLYATYTIDFIPDTAPEAASIKEAQPIWMDVQRGIYPVFDVHRDSGGADGEFSYPKDGPDPYNGHKWNEKTLNRGGVLLGTTGHVHTGGLSTELFLRRDGASYDGPTCDEPQNYDAEYGSAVALIKKAAAGQKRTKRLLKTKAIRKLKKSMKPKKMKRLKKSMKPKRFKKMKRRKMKKMKRLRKVNGKRLRHMKKLNRRKQGALADKAAVEAKAAAAQKAYEDCTSKTPTVDGNQVRLFESVAKYFEPAGPVSWDMAMYSTEDDWRVQVEKGDTLELQATYETKIASWYESMGINVVFWAPDETDGRNPYKVKVDTPGVLNHGHYAENNDHGGTEPVVGPDPTTLADGPSSSGPFDIGPGFFYQQGDYRLPGAAGRPPVVKQGQSFTFKLNSGDASKHIWHSLTSCKSPCNKSTGIAYPIPDGEFQFDSGQLGTGGPPTVERTTWSTPANLPVGTHTYFCRIHPLMRGAFRVVKD